MADPVILVFPSRRQLADAVDRLKTLDYIDTRGTAIITKAADGEVVVYDNDISVREGSITGGTLGSLLAALGVAQLGAFLLPGVGPIIALGLGALAGGIVGGAAGGATAGLMDFGFDNTLLETLAARLKDGYAAAVLRVDDAESIAQRLENDLRRYEVEVLGTGAAS